MKDEELVDIIYQLVRALETSIDWIDSSFRKDEKPTYLKDLSKALSSGQAALNDVDTRSKIDEGRKE